MSGLFGKPPKIPKPVPVPTVDDARVAEDEITRLRKRRGRASTFLTQQQGMPKAPAASAAVSLLGQTGQGAMSAGAPRTERTGPVGRGAAR